MASLKKLSEKDPLLTGGHRLCAGCAVPIIVREVLLAAEMPVVVASATGCLEVSTTIFPFTAWKVPFIHTAFENAAATMSGVEAAYRVLRRRGRFDREVRFVVFSGDGGTYDIGLQSLSGALERGHRILHICYDNEAYMNTGVQRSGSTPMGAWTTTTPLGNRIAGGTQLRKDLTRIVVAHGVPYVAQASPHRWQDVVNKVKRALEVDGPSFLNILSPCPLGWRFEASDSIRIAELAVECCFWPLFEVREGKWKLSYRPREKRPVVEWLRAQGRFDHLFRPENEGVLQEIQDHVDQEWERLLRDCGVSPRREEVVTP